MDLSISQQYAQVGLNIDKPAAKLNIKPPKLNVSSGKPEVEVSFSWPEVHIDQSQSFADIGLRDYRRLSEYNCSKAHSTALEGIKRRVSEGDSLAAIDRKTTIQRVIAARVQAEAECPYNIAYIPEHPPEIDPQTYPIEINSPEADVSVNLDWGEVRNVSPWAGVDMYLLQKPEINVQWTGSYYDAIA